MITHTQLAKYVAGITSQTLERSALKPSTLSKQALLEIEIMVLLSITTQMLNEPDFADDVFDEITNTQDEKIARN